jgi:hypothetical protein
VVLLKNERDTLPLYTRASQKILVVDFKEQAADPTIGPDCGASCGMPEPSFVQSPLNELAARLDVK